MMITYFALIEEESDQQLFERIYRANRLQMLHIAMSILNDHGLAEDAVHVAFIRVAENMHRIDFGYDINPLLRTITRNCAISMLKKRCKEQEFLSSGAVPPQIHPQCTEDDYENKAEVERIARRLAQLPEEYSTIFTLRFRHQYRTKEIAELLGMTDAAVRKRIQRLREYITEWLDEGE